MEKSLKDPIHSVSDPSAVQKKGRGRPVGSLTKKVQKGKVLGRPKELGTKVQELKEKLINSVEGSRIVQKVIDKALNDDDKDQMIALKLCLDRILPVSMFEKAKDQRSSIQINISGLTDVVIDGKDDEKDDIEDAIVVGVTE
jgi:hypothetical protein